MLSKNNGAELTHLYLSYTLSFIVLGDFRWSIPRPFIKASSCIRNLRGLILKFDLGFPKPGLGGTLCPNNFNNYFSFILADEAEEDPDVEDIKEKEITSNNKTVCLNDDLTNLKEVFDEELCTSLLVGWYEACSKYIIFDQSRLW